MNIHIYNTHSFEIPECKTHEDFKKCLSKLNIPDDMYAFSPDFTPEVMLQDDVVNIYPSAKAKLAKLDVSFTEDAFCCCEKNESFKYNYTSCIVI